LAAKPIKEAITIDVRIIRIIFVSFTRAKKNTPKSITLMIVPLDMDIF
jgi:hypothetical protein